MSRLLRVVGKRKKRESMGNRTVTHRGGHEALESDERVELIRELVSLELMEVYEALDEIVATTTYLTTTTRPETDPLPACSR
jgi:hypothetical protein